MDDSLSIEYGFLFWLMQKAKESYCAKSCTICPFNKDGEGCGTLTKADSLEIFYREFERQSEERRR